MEDKSVKNFFNIIDSVLLCMFRVFAFCVMLYGVAYLGEIPGVILLIILCIFGVFYSKEILNNFKKDTDEHWAGTGLTLTRSVDYRNPLYKNID